MRIVPISNNHNRTGFDCGETALNDWLKTIASQHVKKGLSRTFVAIEDLAPNEILGFYSISIAEVANDLLPAGLRRRLPARCPVWRLGRLAVHRSHQGKRIGQLLLFDAIERTTTLVAQGGGIGLVVDAKPSAVAFYSQYGFVEVPDAPLKLFLEL